MFTMPLAPLVVNKTSGDWMWTAASVLGLRSPKLEFDPALDVDFDFPKGNDDVKNSGLSMLERYVSKLLEASFDDSSLFWHYALRHVPSGPSLMCKKEYSDSTNSFRNQTMQFTNDAGIPFDAQNPDVMANLPAQKNASIPLYGYGAFPLGAVPSMCLCGWNVSNGMCQIPAAVCQSSESCLYDPATEAGKQTEQKILDAWPTESQGRWECPWLDLSDAWGIVSAKESDAWILGQQQSFRISELLRAGRAGLRIGNARTLGRDAREQGVWPSERVDNLVPGVALHRCSDTIMDTFDAASVAREVVDDLFPVAQGIHESAPVSFCLRYAIEFSRLRMIRSIRASLAPDSKMLADEIALQKSAADSWRGKCESQLNMLAVCKGSGLFDVVPEKEFAYDCPFVISDSYSASREYYVTPGGGCLLYYRGEFFDPCRHPTKICSSASSKVSFTLQEAAVDQRAYTLVKFDVRSASGSDEILGTWPVKFYDQDEGKNQVAAQVVERLMRWRATSSSSTGDEDALFEASNAAAGTAASRPANIPWRLGKAFIQELFMDGGETRGKGSVGNTKSNGGKGWAAAEGLVTGEGNPVEFCDGIADWWPDVSWLLCCQNVYSTLTPKICFYQNYLFIESKISTQDWTKPVGYHVTLPCSNDQAGFRTFDSMFAIDRGDGTLSVSSMKMRYMHTMLRDQDAYHSR